MKRSAVKAAFNGVLGLLLLTISAAHTYAFASPLGVNVLSNPSFEIGSAVAPSNWNASGGGWSGNAEISYTGTAARTGTKGIQFKTTSPAYIAQNNIAIIERGTYELSTYYRASRIDGSGVEFKVEYFSALPMNASTFVADYFVGRYEKDTSNTWVSITRTTVVPKGAHYARVYVRLFGAGDVQFDDVSFMQVAEPPMIDYLKTDQIFYYTNVSQGTVRAELYPVDGILSNKHVDLTIKRAGTGTTILVMAMNLPAQAAFQYVFDPRPMSVQAEYVAELVLRDDGGNELERASTSLYRWARPTSLTSTGTLLVNGKPFHPKFMYHVDPPDRDDDYAKVRAAGFNTVQGLGGGNRERIRELLDWADQNGLKMLVPLYNKGQLPSKAYIDSVVSYNKDHPALLAWMMIDEPSDKYILEEMRNVYINVRSLDPVHPMYLVEADWDHFERNGKVTDILATDSYPIRSQSDTDPVTLTKVGTAVRNALTGVSGKKPVWVVMQAFPYGGPLPTIEQVRFMNYQALLSGAEGFGYYAFHDSSWNLQASALWPGLLGFDPEFTLIGELSQSPKLSGGIVNGVRWAIWKNDRHVYAALTNESTQSQSVTVTLPFTGYRAELLYGGSAPPFTSTTNQLIANVGSGAALLYRLSDNVLLNADVEADANNDSKPDDWSIRLGTWSTQENHSGSRSIALTPSTAYNVFNSSPPHPVTPGKSYTLRGWVKNSSTTDGIYLGVREIDSSGVTVHYTWKKVDSNSGWKEYEIRFTPSTRTSTFAIFGKSESTANGTAWFDDFYLREDYDNRVANPGTEFDANSDNKPDEWRSNVMWDGSIRHSGLKSIKLLPDTTSNNNVIKSEYISDVAPVNDYRLAFSARNASTTGKVSVSVRLVNGSGSSITYIEKVILNGTDWTDYELLFTTSDNTAQVQIYLQNGVDTNSNYVNGSAWFDDFYLEPAS